MAYSRRVRPGDREHREQARGANGAICYECHAGLTEAVAESTETGTQPLSVGSIAAELGMAVSTLEHLLRSEGAVRASLVVQFPTVRHSIGDVVSHATVITETARAINQDIVRDASRA